MTGQHTPGPWVLREHERLYGADVFAADGKRICSYVRNDADKRLIACAPELLAALEKAHAEIASSPGDIWSLEGARNHEERAALIRNARGVKPKEPNP